MGKRRGSRLYPKRGRFYADLRDYAEQGGGQEALVPEGGRCATRDRDVATQLLARRLEELEAIAAGRGQAKPEDPYLTDCARRHLRLKALENKASSVKRSEGSLRQLVAFFGTEVRLSEISVERLNDYVVERLQQPGSRYGTTIREQTVLHELNALGSLFDFAISENKATSNPVRAMRKKPRIRRKEAVYLEPGEVARLLDAAADLDTAPSPRAVPFLYPLLCTFVYTGGRAGEVFGLLRRDIDFDNGVVHFRENSWRGLKHERHERGVPLWPDLHQALDRHIPKGPQGDELVFPSSTGGILKDIRGSLSRALSNAEIEKAVTLHSLRHTYTAARLQTLDHGAPVSLFTVARELGHRSVSLIESTYGHLLHVRHRTPVVEYRRTDVLPMRGRRRALGE